MFIPVTRQELTRGGRHAPDVILVTGDTYIDSPYIGVAVVGKTLLKHGFTVAIISQPSLNGGDDIMQLGEPALFWGVTAGSIDSMVANYTASMKYRRQDDYTPGGVNRRPDRACIAYSNLIRRYFKHTRPVVLGGMEASLRRIAHYDAFDKSIRRSILPDSKADILVYGMAEKTVVQLAEAIRSGTDWKKIPGICYMSNHAPEGFRTIPSFETVSRDKTAFMSMSVSFQGLAGQTETGFVQQHGNRFLVHNPARAPLTSNELDGVYEMDYEHDVHPVYKTGKVRALDTIRQSITSHRGCIGQCHFCAIAVHQGTTIVSRSVESIASEAQSLSRKKGFNGIIYDVGGPTANMYGMTCRKNRQCHTRHCLLPEICPNLVFGHRQQMELLTRLSGLPGIKKVFVSSGIRHDLVVADRKWGLNYLGQLIRHHVSGQIKLAPEHSEPDVLKLMNKPPIQTMMDFKAMFDKLCHKNNRRYFMTYYLMAAHPGCSPQHMRALNAFLVNSLKTIPEQVQIFTPTPATLSTAMFYCKTDVKGHPITCDTTTEERTRQKSILKRATPPRKR